MNVKTKRLTADAMLAAMCAVLGYVAIDMGVMKITLESFPILLGALLFGPLDGALIGFVGTLIYQLMYYGVSATTLLWILPYVMMGLICGFCAKNKGFELSRAQTFAAVVLGEITVTAMNSGVIYLDSVIYGYYYPGIVLGMLVMRCLVCIIVSVVFGLILPAVVKSVKKAI